MRTEIFAIVSTADGKTKKYKAILNCGRRVIIPGCTVPITAITVRALLGRTLPASLEFKLQNGVGAVFIPHWKKEFEQL